MKKLLAMLSIVFLVACGGSDNKSADAPRGFKTVTFDNYTIPAGRDYHLFDGTNLKIKSTADNKTTGVYEIDGVEFTTAYQTWAGGYTTVGGFTISSANDMTTVDVYNNAYSVYYPTGNDNSTNFAVIYDTADILMPKPADVKGIYVNNTTFAYSTMVNGSAFNNPISSTKKYFSVVFIGYNKGGDEVARVAQTLGDGKVNFITDSWIYVDLKPLKNVDKISIEFDSDEVGNYGINLPLYVALDDLQIYE